MIVSADAALPTHTRYVGLEAGKSDRPDLQSARRVVSGGRGVGSAAMRWAEARVFEQHRNCLLCVSSFNRAAQRLYRRAVYQVVGRLRDYVVAGHDEILMRKTLGPLSSKNTNPSR